jgi:hypothetical protein
MQVGADLTHCAMCGKYFRPDQALSRPRRAKFCSDECEADSHRKVMREYQRRKRAEQKQAQLRTLDEADALD